MSEKTEEPTPKRLQKAKEDGNSGQSATLSQSVGFLVALSLLKGAVVAAAGACVALLTQAFHAAALPDANPTWEPTTVALAVLVPTLPILAAAALTTALVNVVQTGGFIATKKLIPKLEALDPIAGFSKLFSLTRLFSVVKALAGAALVSYLVFRVLRTHIRDLVVLSGEPRHFRVPLELAESLSFNVALVGLGLGALDFFVVRRAWIAQLRMGKDEVRREHKENDGDPQIKAARERAHHEMLAQATVASVRHASVVVVNPTHIACALRYRENATEDEAADGAPVLLAAGEGDLARQIIEAARAYGIPVLRDVPLARALRDLELGEEIPEALYEAVAIVLQEATRDVSGAD